MKCKLCKMEIGAFGNNGAPLVDGVVCNDCNNKVIIARINLARGGK